MRSSGYSGLYKTGYSRLINNRLINNRSQSQKTRLLLGAKQKMSFLKTVHKFSSYKRGKTWRTKRDSKSSPLTKQRVVLTWARWRIWNDLQLVSSPSSSWIYQTISSRLIRDRHLEYWESRSYSSWGIWRSEACKVTNWSFWRSWWSWRGWVWWAAILMI